MVRYYRGGSAGRVDHLRTRPGGPRQTKKPKIYFCDSGIFHYLLDIHSLEQLSKTPKLGASFEGFALEQIIRIFNRRSEDCYYWGIHQEAELDLLIFQKGQRLGFQFKFSDTPQVTPSMHKGIEHLKLDKLYVIYPGSRKYRLSETIEVIPIRNIMELATN
jgi:hypothetical protein